MSSIERAPVKTTLPEKKTIKPPKNTEKITMRTAKEQQSNHLYSWPSEYKPRENVALICTVNVISFIQSLYIENLLVFHCKLRMRDLNNTR